jgi:hypothetical protein
MGSFSIVHWIIVAIVFAPVFPIARILVRTGKNPVWSLLYFVPLVNVVALFLFANSRWSVREGA